MSMENKGFTPEQEKTPPTKEEIERAFHYGEIKGLEELGLSDADVWSSVPPSYHGGLEHSIDRLYRAGWDFDRINKAKEGTIFQWTEEEVKEAYEKAERSEIDKLSNLAEDGEEFLECVKELEVDLPISEELSKEIEELGSVADELDQSTNIILAERYVELAKIAEKEGKADLFERSVSNAYIALTFTSPPEDLIESLEEMRKRLKPC